MSAATKTPAIRAGLTDSDVQRLHGILAIIRGRIAVMRRGLGDEPEADPLASAEAEGFRLLLDECSEAAEHIRDILDAGECHPSAAGRQAPAKSKPARLNR